MSRFVAVAIALVSLTASPLVAHAAPVPERTSRWAFLMSSGALLPTGSQRALITRGAMSTAQLSYSVQPALAFNTTLGWARVRDLALGDESRLDVITYDVGGEMRSPRMRAGHATLQAFAGVGAGGRRYAVRHDDGNATHDLAAYGSAGGEIGLGRIQLRLEAREQVVGDRWMGGSNDSRVRSDVALLAGLRIVR